MAVGFSSDSLMMRQVIKCPKKEPPKAVENPAPAPEAAKPASKKKETPSAEQAANKLKFAKNMLRLNEDAGKMKLRELIDAHPDTEAAREAAKLLGK